MQIASRFLLACALLSVSTAPAWSEPSSWDLSVSAFGGTAIPFATRAKITDPTIPADLTVSGVRLDSSPSFGGKLTIWNRRQVPDSVGNIGLQPDLGIELDITRFSPDIKAQTRAATGVLAGSAVTQASPIAFELDTTVIALNLLARFPIGVRDDLPSGRWYPYVGIGAGAAITRAKTVTGQQDTSTEPAFQFLGGLKYFLSRHIGVFAEYKFTHVSHPFEITTTRQEVILNVNHLLVGIAAHY
jgi:opacity protein-like surface antigen